MKRSKLTQVPSPEFSRRVVVKEIAAEGDTREIVAGPEERDALARRFGLLAFGALSASLRLQPLAHGLVRVEGRLTAALAQRCVVTLEPTARRIDASFALVYGPTAAAVGPHEVVMTADEDAPAGAHRGRRHRPGRGDGTAVGAGTRRFSAGAER